MSIGVVLYGPPASGKDTITAALTQLDPTYQLFRRLKVGPGRRAGYRMTTAGHVNKLRADGEVVWENSRYGATYVVDRHSLGVALSAGIPVVHLGQPEATVAVRTATPATAWLIVWLWCPRDIAARRLEQRNATDVADRLVAWDSTPAFPSADMTIDTSTVSPAEAAASIGAHVYLARDKGQRI
jgi:guanylate kinase